MGLLCSESFVILTSTIFNDWSTHVTDGRTDRRALAYSTIAYMLSRAKNVAQAEKFSSPFFWKVW